MNCLLCQGNIARPKRVQSSDLSADGPSLLSQYLFRLRQFSRQLWARAALITALAVVAAALAPVLTPLVPAQILSKLEQSTVRSLLDILANSMLAVTTFSLTIMVTAHLTASQQVTPRAHRVLREDGRTQSVLATFVGAFVYSLTGIVMMQLELISEQDLALLYITTLVVLGIVIVAVLRWIGRLALIGSLEETTRKVETAAREALERRMSQPFLGGHALLQNALPEAGHDIASPRSGYITHIDTAAMSDIAGDAAAKVYLTAMPGDWVGEGDRLAAIDLRDLDHELESSLRACFSLSDSRTFEQDAAFGISVLTEIAERALSPSTNDPQTANDIVARLLLILESAEQERASDEPEAPNVFAPGMDFAQLLERGFDPIARDGKGFFEVQMHVQTALARLAKHRNADISQAARIQARRALAYAEDGLLLQSDIARVRAISIADAPASVSS